MIVSGARLMLWIAWFALVGWVRRSRELDYPHPHILWGVNACRCAQCLVDRARDYRERERIYAEG